VSESIKKKYTLGALYYSLDQLHRKGFVTKSREDLSSGKAGRSRTYYTLTMKGKQVLQEARDYQQRVWNGIPEMAFTDKSSE
jgi:DNA-binding PadR family transcriptional regulator